MFIPARARRALTVAVGVALAAAVTAPSAFAHEQRTVGAYVFTVGFMDEPVYAGQKSGLEFHVVKGDQPVDGLEKTLKAEAIYGQARLDLPLSARFGAPGWYESVFFPTAAGQYAFHISGTIEGTDVDEMFTSGPSTFGDVSEATSAQFPVQLPSTVELAAQAKEGADAAGLVPVAVGAGAIGVVVGLIALGVALAGRRREA